MLLVFDIDGVLIESKGLHEAAFARALCSIGIKLLPGVHEREYCGLPTKVKLEKMGIVGEDARKVYDEKQKFTFEMMPHYCKVPEKVKLVLYNLSENHEIVLASNAISDFCEAVAKEVKVSAGWVSAQALEPKPSPAVYEYVMRKYDANPKNTLVFEDNRFGLEAAFKSGANVYPVRNPYDLNEHRIEEYIQCLT